MVSLNDALAGRPSASRSYDEGKSAVLAGRSQDRIYTDAGGYGTINDAMVRLSGPAAMSDAVLFLDAAVSGGREPRAKNLGTGGSALDARYGSALGAYVYAGAARLPGLVGNALTVPDENALDITGDIEIVIHASLADWTPASTAHLISKDTGASNKSWWVQISTAGLIQFAYSTNGTAANFRNSTAPGFVDGQAYWIKVAVDADNGAGGHTVVFSKSDDGVTWQHINTAVTGGTISMFAGNSPVVLGAGGSAGAYGNMNGSLRRATVRDGIDGTTVLDVNLSDVPDYATSFTATTGQTVTVNSTGADTNDPLFLPHTGENYAYFPGGAGNGMWIDQVAPSAPTSVDIRVRVEDWKPTVDYSPFFQYRNGPFSLSSLSDGRLAAVVWSTDSSVSAPRYPPPSVSIGTSFSGWLAFTFNTSTRAYAYYRYDGVGVVAAPESLSEWTVVSSGSLGGGAASGQWNGTLDSSTSAWTDIMANNKSGGSNVIGKFFRAEVRDSVGGAVIDVFDVTEASFTSGDLTFLHPVTGNTVTVNRATTGRKTALVTRPIWLFGTDDYLEVADNDLLDFDFSSEEMSVIVVYRTWHRSGPGNAHVLAKAPSGGIAAAKAYIVLDSSTTGNFRFQISDGTSNANAVTAAAPLGSLAVMSGRASAGGATVGLNDGSYVTAAGTAADASNSLPLRIGTASNNVSDVANMECVAVAIWRRVLTDDEIAEINAYYGTA